MFLYSKLLKELSKKRLNEFNERYIRNKNDEDFTVLDAVMRKLSHYILEYDYVVCESPHRGRLKKFSDLYANNYYDLAKFVSKANKIVKLFFLNSKRPVYAKIYSNFQIPIEWRTPHLYEEDYMAY